LLRYFKRELVPKGAIDVQELPKYFAAWIQKGSDQCIYTALQLKRFKPPHLEAGCWYLDCIRDFVIDSEAEVKSTCDGGVQLVVGVEDSVQVIEDDDEQQDQSSAPPPKSRRGRRLRAASEAAHPTQPQASEQTQAESTAHGPGQGTGAQFQVLSIPSPSPSTVPSLVSALETSKGLIERRKAKQIPTTSSSAMIPHSAEVFISNNSVESLMTSHLKNYQVNSGDPRWVEFQDFLRKVRSNTWTGLVRRCFLNIANSNLTYYFVSGWRRPPNRSLNTVHE
jgi:hypothetical protein